MYLKYGYTLAMKGPRYLTKIWYFIHGVFHIGSEGSIRRQVAGGNTQGVSSRDVDYTLKIDRGLYTYFHP